jgi:hypothetical protein
MKKIITTLVFIAFSTVSSKAIDLPTLPDLGMFSLTAGVASNTSVWGASAKETNFAEDGSMTGGSTNKESGAFVEDYASQFIELGIGRFVSVGYELASDKISTPTNVASEGGAADTSTANEMTVAVDFVDFETIYAKLNIPGGAYLKFGEVETTMNIKKTGGTATSVYGGKTVTGTSTGVGYQRFLGDTGFGFRFEGNYVDLDNVTTDNGAGASGNLNKIDATNIEGAHAKVALTYTLGRNN